ncbi:MAG: hypothetical protein CR217_00215 [Beijerinckiaceae bacterium]|nr:MAG: hypothetical protein CR217_00215 [Beijerinckiaceae bacterium]
MLKRFRAALDKIYGSRLDRVVLFGSHARGEARPDSDYDGKSLQAAPLSGAASKAA